MKFIQDNWEIILFLLTITYKQIDGHFKIIAHDTKIVVLEKNLESVRSEIHEALKEQSKQTTESIKELTKATGELVVATRVMASQLEDIRKGK